jgi:sulfate transport system ATP-binding protein
VTVVVENMSKHFGTGVVGRKVAAVNGVSFQAAPGSITSLLGPSGSGKSTLLRLIAGLEEPEAGKVMIGERDCTRVSPRERNVGFVFQSYALFRHMSIFDNIAFGMKIRKVPKADRKARVEELLQLVQLPGVGERYPAQLSGGQRQRVALARALATDPKVLLLDEPFGALDTQVRVELRQWLLGFQEKAGVTTLLVTHDQEEAFELSQHVVLLNEGRVVQAGSPHQLYDEPATPFVASFLGGANVFRGTVQSGQADVGTLSVRAPTGTKDGSSLQAFVRPQDIKITKGDDSHADVSLAKIERLTRIGGQVKLALELPSGESMTVHMPKTEVDSLGLEAGDRVMVDLKDAKVFVEDYSI